MCVYVLTNGIALFVASQLQVLRHLSTSYAFDAITLIDGNTESVYYGSIPDNIAESKDSNLTKPEWRIDLNHICTVHNHRNNIRFVHGIVTDIDLSERSIYVDDGSQVRYDVLAIDIGSKSKSIADIPGAFRNVIPTRPIKYLMDRLEEIEKEDFCADSYTHVSDSDTLELEQPPLTVAVVGGGASGIELALSIVGKWKPLLKGRAMSVRLVTSEQTLLPEIPYARKRLKDILADSGIFMIFQSAVDRVEEGCLHLESGMSIPFSYCFWATGAAPHHLARTQLPKNGLAISKEGWIEVNSMLQSMSHPEVFAAGDCSSLEKPLPKAGIFALQEGPVMAENLERFVRQQHLHEFHPDMDDLQFLSCGDGTAMGFAFGLVLRGEWVYQVKQAMDRHHFLTLKGDPTSSSPGHPSYHCEKDVLEHVRRTPTRQAAKMLTQIDVGNYREAWAVLELMSIDKEYRHKLMKDFNRFATMEERCTEKRQKKEANELPPHLQILNWFLPAKRDHV